MSQVMLAMVNSERNSELHFYSLHLMHFAAMCCPFHSSSIVTRYIRSSDSAIVGSTCGSPLFFSYRNVV